MNRTSLENLFYTTGDSIYTKEVEVTGMQWKVMEGDRRSWNSMEVSGKHENIP